MSGNKVATARGGLVRAAELPIATQRQIVEGQSLELKCGLALNDGLARELWYELYSTRCPVELAERLCWRALDDEQLEFVLTERGERRKPALAALGRTNGFSRLQMGKRDWGNLTPSTADLLLSKSNESVAVMRQVMAQASWKAGVIWGLRDQQAISDEEWAERLVRGGVRRFVSWPLLTGLLMERPGVRSLLIPRFQWARKPETVETLMVAIAQSGVPGCEQRKFVDNVLFSPGTGYGPEYWYRWRALAALMGSPLATDETVEYCRVKMAKVASFNRFSGVVVGKGRGMDPATITDPAELEEVLRGVERAVKAKSEKSKQPDYYTVVPQLWAGVALSGNPTLSTEMRGRLSTALLGSRAKAELANVATSAAARGREGGGELVPRLKWGIGSKIGDSRLLDRRLGRIAGKAGYEVRGDGAVRLGQLTNQAEAKLAATRLGEVLGDDADAWMLAIELFPVIANDATATEADLITAVRSIGHG